MGVPVGYLAARKSYHILLSSAMSYGRVTKSSATKVKLYSTSSPSLFIST